MSDFGEQCFIGNLLLSVNLKNASCHKSWYKKNRGYLKISSLSNNDRELLMWRSGVRKIIANAPDSVNENYHNSVCYHHHSMFLTCYEAKQKKCINPFGLHPNSRKKKQRQGQYTFSYGLTISK